MACKAQSGFDVFGLGRLVPTGQQNDQFLPSLLEIHPITRAIVDPQFRNTITNRLNIAGVSCGKSFDPCLNTCSCPEVTQVVEPLCEEKGFADFNHKVNVVAWLHSVNVMMG